MTHEIIREQYDWKPQEGEYCPICGDTLFIALKYTQSSKDDVIVLVRCFTCGFFDTD